MLVLGIESSCDETGLALYDTASGLLAHELYSQVSLHADYGGVVPELASRDHVRKALPLIYKVCEKAGITLTQIQGIAYTKGPGLLGALLVGATLAKTLAMVLDIPVLGVHHMEGHLLAPMLEDVTPQFPFVALLVSGGHTQLVDVKNVGGYVLLGESLDDAAGEAFDKTAKLLGLGLPGGPLLSKLAEKGDPARYRFPRPMTDRPGLDFSFSGLKTFVLNTWLDSDKSEQTKADIAKAFEMAVVDVLMIKCKRALLQTGYKTLVLAGGVSANQTLRAQMKALATKLHTSVFYPRGEFCTDNGAMIAYAGARRLLKGERDPDLQIDVKTRWPLTELV